MHEWALADAVAMAIRDSLGGRDPRSLARVELRVGELQAVDREILRFALKTILEPYGIDAGRVTLGVEKAELLCRRCGRRWAIHEDESLSDEQREAVHFLPEAVHAFLRCPSCNAADFSVEKGRGVRIDRVILEAGGDTEG
jgi:hydrogenase nickel incorporation protein HypA/HybF